MARVEVAEKPWSTKSAAAASRICSRGDLSPPSSGAWRGRPGRGRVTASLSPLGDVREIAAPSPERGDVVGALESPRFGEEARDGIAAGQLDGADDHRCRHGGDEGAEACRRESP